MVNIVDCCVKVYRHGKFYNVYGDDAKVVSIITDYRIINNRLGFPINMINKVMGLLDNKKISYIILNKDNVVNEYKGINKIYKCILDKCENQ